MLRRLIQAGLFLALCGGSPMGCDCARATSVQNAAEVPGVYVWRRVNTDDPSNQLTLNTDGGYCHRYIMDGGIGSECGSWKYEWTDPDSLVGLSDFRADQYSDRFAGHWRGFEIERLRGKRRLVIDSDIALYFVHFDGGAN